MSSESDSKLSSATAYMNWMTKNDKKIFRRLQKSMSSFSTPHELSPATIVVEAAPGSVHSSSRLLPTFIADIIAKNFPKQLSLHVLTDILGGFAENIEGIDFRFQRLRVQFGTPVAESAPAIPVEFTYDGFDWNATVRHSVTKKKHPVSKKRQWFYITHVQLPCDSYVFRDELCTGENDNRLATSDSTEIGRHALEFSNVVLSFVSHVTGRRDYAHVLPMYDIVAHRASIIVLFPDNLEKSRGSTEHTKVLRYWMMPKERF
jgi:hypothetical protein